MFKTLLYIFIGGGLGSIFRYLIHTSFTKLSIVFPIGTMSINIAGSFLIGFLYILFEKNIIGNDLRLFLIIGFCGGFTTFSSFAFENLQLLKDGQYFPFFMYAILSVVCCIFFVWLGGIVAQEFK